MNKKKWRTPRILIADDETKNIQVLGTLLQQKNYYINVAQNGRDALETICEVLPDLVLLDIMMPGMDGFEVCRQLKSLPETKDIPIIFLTVKSDKADIVRGFELGAADYVTKPFNTAELLARVQTHLNLRMLQQQLKQQNAELTAANKKLSFLHSEMLLIEERERRQIAHELHDNIGQNLVLLKMKLRALEKAPLSNGLAKISDDLRMLTGQIIQETRSLTFEASPPMLYELGLIPTLGWLVEKFETQHHMKIDFSKDKEPHTMNEPSKFLVFRIIRELLMNIVKHAKTGRAGLLVTTGHKILKVIVKDDGIGFDVNTLKANLGIGQSFGLFGIRERLAYLKGDMDICSEIGRGTTIILRIPLKNMENHHDEPLIPSS